MFIRAYIFIVLVFFGFNSVSSNQYNIDEKIQKNLDLDALRESGPCGPSGCDRLLITKKKKVEEKKVSKRILPPKNEKRSLEAYHNGCGKPRCNYRSASIEITILEDANIPNLNDMRCRRGQFCG